MAKYGIFYNGQLVKIASDENAKNVHLSRWVNSVAKEITDAQWNSFFEESKTATLSNDVITEVNRQSPFEYTEGATPEQQQIEIESFKEKIKIIIEDQIKIVEASNRQLQDSTWNDYLSKLQSVDTSSINPPVGGYFQTWFNSNYNSTKSILELP